MKLLKETAIILTLATLWFCSAYYATYALFPLWALQCGLIGLIVALLGIAIINRSQRGSQILYEGENESEELHGAKLIIWLLIGLPVSFFFGGTIWWLAHLLGLFPF